MSAQTSRIRLVVAYNGTHFRGLAPNSGVRTVVGELLRCLEPLVGFEPDIVMSGRTDAGVHAWGQVLSTDVPVGADLGRIQRSLNSRLGPEVVVREIAVADDDFSARFSAIGRRYRYHIVNRDVPDPFLDPTAWWVAQPLALDDMADAAAHFIGEHDFSSFCRRPVVGPGHPEPTMVRRVTGARWTVLDPGDVLRFEIEGSAFCQQMVRSIVGMLVYIGRGRRAVTDVPVVLAARDRNATAPLAPPKGLTLWQVDY